MIHLASSINFDVDAPSTSVKIVSSKSGVKLDVPEETTSERKSNDKDVKLVSEQSKDPNLKQSSFSSLSKRKKQKQAQSVENDSPVDDAMDPSEKDIVVVSDENQDNQRLDQDLEVHTPRDKSNQGFSKIFCCC